MAAIALTLTRLSPNQDFTVGNKKFKFRTITTDTGDYAADGVELTAASFGLKRFSYLSVSPVAIDTTNADAYIVARPVGLRFNSERTKAWLLFYESAADGDGMDEKPAEAMVVSTLHAMAIGN